MKKVINVILLMFLAIPTTILASDGICVDYETSQIIIFIGKLLKFVKIVVPILLIIFVIIDIIKIIMDNDVDTKKLFNSVKSRTIAAVVVFLVPTLVSAGLSIIPKTAAENNKYLSCMDCMFDTKGCSERSLKYKEEHPDPDKPQRPENPDIPIVPEIPDKPVNPENPNDGYSEYPIHTSTITGLKYVLYNQNDPTWANIRYQQDTVGVSGCGLTSVAVIASAYDKSVTPKTVATHSKKEVVNGRASEGVPDLTNNKFTCKRQSMYNKDVIENLKKGNVAMIYVAGPNSPFTNKHHYMALIDISQDGSKVFVGNSFSSGTGEYNKSDWYSVDDVFKGNSSVFDICEPTDR